MTRALLLGVAGLFLGCLEPALPPAELDAGAADAGPYRCSPMTCTGCCSNNFCRGGNEDEACGYTGRACRECQAGTTCLTPGTCVGTPRDAGADTRSSADAGGLTNPFTGGPLEPPTRRCYFVFGRQVCN